MRSGNIRLPGTIGALRVAGQNGYNWSSRTYTTTTDAYRFSFTTTDVNPSDSSNCYDGRPLRCLSTVLDM